MRLILVHGINQQGKSEAALEAAWLASLDKGLGRSGAFAAIDVSTPFYGDVLSELSKRGGTDVISQGPGGEPDMEEAAFLAAGLTEAAQTAGIGAAEIAAEQRLIARTEGPVEQSLVMNRRLNAIVRVLERVSPLHGKLVMRLLKQAYAYLKLPNVGPQVDAIVRPVLEAGPAVVVAHSLGTVVTFKLLRAMALEGRPMQVPLYVTLGSPLSLMAVQAALGPAFTKPAGVGRWLNAVDPDDFVSLGRGLDASNFCDGIDNVVDIENDPDDGHAIEGYLADRRIAEAVAAACPP